MPPKDYLQLLGALIYLTKSRPEISTSVSFAATHAKDPTRGDFEELLVCLKYLGDTKDKGLRLRRGISNRPLELRCYVDASYLTHADSKGHTGYCMSFGTVGTFYSKSSKQTLVATSSTHAEIRALYALVVDIVFVTVLCDELQRPIELPAIILEDNQASIELSAPMSSRTKRCKHFLMLINYIREQVEAGLIQLQKVHTHANYADLLTKILQGQLFTDHADTILGILE